MNYQSEKALSASPKFVPKTAIGKMKKSDKIMGMLEAIGFWAIEGIDIAKGAYRTRPELQSPCWEFRAMYKDRRLPALVSCFYTMTACIKAGRLVYSDENPNLPPSRCSHEVYPVLLKCSKCGVVKENEEDFCPSCLSPRPYPFALDDAAGLGFLSENTNAFNEPQKE